ncbi:hypothetical protein FI667_g3675, partial [Globisporangium splendens]
MMEDEDEEVLAWKTLEVHDVHDDVQQTHQQHAGDHRVHSSGISTGTDDDVEDFSELTYDPSRAAAAVPAHHSEHHQHHDGAHGGALLHASSSSLQQHHVDQRHLPSSGAQQHQRFKRKNFSKQLQLLCLQRYAQYAKDHGKLPDKTECQFLLHQSYMQFLKEGGSADEPRLSHQEFLKLIRNRRREMYVRNAQKHKFHHHQPSHAHGSGGATDVNSVHQQPLSAAKRKLQQEHAKIYELIEIIDQAREQSGLVPEHHHHHSQPHHHSHLRHPIGRTERHHLMLKPSPLVATQEPPQVPPLADPQDQIDLIFQLQQETLEIQREIAERLKVIRLRRSVRQNDSMEPSSASV